MGLFPAIKVRVWGHFLAVPACLLIFPALLTGCGGNSTQSSQSAIPLVIVTNPASQTVPLGETGSFSVTATGPGTLTYQWSENGTPISGATGSSYTTPATQLTDSGDLFTVVVSDSAASATSTPAKLTIGARSPKSGDLRFQQVDAPSTSVEGTDSLESTGISISGYSHTSDNFSEASGSPLELGPTDFNCDTLATRDCAWSFWITALPITEPGLSMLYACDVYESLNADLASLPASTSVVTSLDIPPGTDTFAVAVTSNSNNAGFAPLQEVVPPAAIQSTVAADGLKSRVVSAISFDTAGQAHILSYSWTADPSTVYDVTSSIVQPADVAATATTLAAQGYIITAFGGNDANGYVLIGTKVQGDALPRNLLVYTQSSASSSPNAVNGYAPVGFVSYPTAQYPQGAADYTILYEQ